MVVFRGLLWAAIILALLAAWRRPSRSDAGWTALTFLSFLVLYSGFHLVGFAYERHVMPIVMPVALYLLWRCSETIRATGKGSPLPSGGVTS